VHIYHVAGLTLAMFVAACSPPPAGTSAGQTIKCVNASSAHHAYVVVQHLSGAGFQKCVGFEGATIDGQTLMDQSGVQYLAHTLNEGKAVCQVDSEPQQVTNCFPQNQPYWALFLETKRVWTGSTTSFTEASLHDGDALGWHYVAAADASPAPPPLARPLPVGSA
jgi:hypothetical protein